jgi:phosphohistidine phosphatase
MELVILRHGKAGPAEHGTSDRDRALTSKGIEDIRKVARWLSSHDLVFDMIITSPLKRARETAEIVSTQSNRKSSVTVWEILSPGGSPEETFREIGRIAEDSVILLVGHEPDLSRLVSRIIAGNDNASIALAKGGMAYIKEFSPSRQPSGELSWLLSPKLIPG